MVNGPKHYRDLHDNTFIMLIDHCEDNWVGTNLSDSYGKFQDCLLTHWLPISSVLFLIGTISMQSIQMQLSKKKNFFLKFFHHFLNLDKFLNILKKKIWRSLLMHFRNYRLRKTLLDKCLRGLVMVQNIVEICTAAPLSCLLIPVKTVESEEVFLSDMENLRTVYWDIDCRRQVFSS